MHQIWKIFMCDATNYLFLTLFLRQFKTRFEVVLADFLLYTGAELQGDEGGNWPLSKKVNTGFIIDKELKEKIWAIFSTLAKRITLLIVLSFNL